MNKSFKRGFTLIELLVVVAIIGILAVIVILNLTGAKNRSRYARVVSDMTNISTAVRSYSMEHNNIYPDDVSPGVKPGALTDYLPGAWPTTPCGDSISQYDYQHWVSCGGGANTSGTNGTVVGMDYNKIGNAPKFYYNLKGMDTCMPVATYGADILTISPKEITCHE